MVISGSNINNGEARPGELLARGAEASIYLAEDETLGTKVIRKVRHTKGYRARELDETIRFRRTRNEARLLHMAKAAGVRVPYVYDVDMDMCAITMEYIQGERLRDVMTEELAREVGSCIGRLHKANIIHGDLTTSNMILAEKVILIDLSLGEVNEELEAKGVDIHVLAENFKAIHTNIDFEAVITGYKEVFDIPIREKLETIEKRGRYQSR